MKAVVYERYGPPDVLELRDVEKPEPGDDEVLIHVHAAEATKADCELRSFQFAVSWFLLPLRLALGVFKPRRKILGGYFSGEVVAVGTQAAGFVVGDEVYGSSGLRLGGYGEYVALPASATISRKPGNMSYVEAAAVPLGGLNALHFMRLANIQPGEKVLVNGAGASIGSHAVQIARSMGATVTAVDSAIKQHFLKCIGADECIDYAKEDFTARNERYDVVFDMVASSDYDACVRALRPGGRYLTANPRLMTMLRSTLTTRFSDKTVRFAFAAERKEELEDLTAMIEAGQIESIVDRVLSMYDAAEAHRLVETEQRRGAIVLQIAGSE